MIVCLGYNETYHYYSVAFFALLQSKTYETYRTLHSLILMMRSWKPSLLTVDFEPGHIKVNVYIYYIVYKVFYSIFLGIKWFIWGFGDIAMLLPFRPSFVEKSLEIRTQKKKKHKYYKRFNTQSKSISIHQHRGRW